MKPDADESLRIGGSHTILLLGLGLIAITIATAGFAVWELRQRTEQSYHREIASLNTVLAEQTARYLNAIDLVLKEVQARSAALDIRTTEQFHTWLESADANVFLR